MAARSFAQPPLPARPTTATARPRTEVRRSARRPDPLTPGAETMTDRRFRGIAAQPRICLIAATGGGITLLGAKADVADLGVGAREGADAVGPARGEGRTRWDPVARVETPDHAQHRAEARDDRGAAIADGQAGARAGRGARLGIRNAVRPQRIAGRRGIGAEAGRDVALAPHGAVAVLRADRVADVGGRDRRFVEGQTPDVRALVALGGHVSEGAALEAIGHLGGRRLARDPYAEPRVAAVGVARTHLGAITMRRCFRLEDGFAGGGYAGEPAGAVGVRCTRLADIGKAGGAAGPATTARRSPCSSSTPGRPGDVRGAPVLFPTGPGSCTVGGRRRAPATREGRDRDDDGDDREDWTVGQTNPPGRARGLSLIAQLAGCEGIIVKKRVRNYNTLGITPCSGRLGPRRVLG